MGLMTWQFSIVAFAQSPAMVPTKIVERAVEVLLTVGLTRTTFLTVPLLTQPKSPAVL